jgi:hypothetical protein
MAQRTCPYCTTLLTSRRVQCGAPECRRQWQNDRVKQFQARWKAEHGERYEDRYRTIRTWTCLGCSTPHRSSGATRNYQFCGHECRDRWRRRAAAERQLAQAATGTRGHGLWWGGACGSCGATFVARSRGGQPEFCSDLCKRREKSRRRRAAARGIKTTSGRRYAVYVRDGWRCQLCRKKVRRNVGHRHPLAPSIDHITPLAKCADLGVRDGPENWQTAHRICNSLKRDGTAPNGDQTRLFG